MSARPTVVFDGAILAAGPPTGVAGSFVTTLRAYTARDAARASWASRKPRATRASS